MDSRARPARSAEANRAQGDSFVTRSAKPFCTEVAATPRVKLPRLRAPLGVRVGRLYEARGRAHETGRVVASARHGESVYVPATGRGERTRHRADNRVHPTLCRSKPLRRVQPSAKDPGPTRPCVEVASVERVSTLEGRRRTSSTTVRCPQVVPGAYL